MLFISLCLVSRSQFLRKTFACFIIIKLDCYIKFAKFGSLIPENLYKNFIATDVGLIEDVCLYIYIYGMDTYETNIIIYRGYDQLLYLSVD